MEGKAIRKVNFNKWKETKSFKELFQFESIDYSTDKKILFFYQSLRICLVEKCVANLLCKVRKHVSRHISEKENECRDIQLLGNDLGRVQEEKDRNIKKLFLHVAHDCNLSCGYCYAQGGTYGRNVQMMDIDTAERTIDFIIGSNSTIKDFVIEFFGGEPMLNYKMINELVQKIVNKYSDINFIFGCVTNATIINDEIQDLFRKYDFHVMLTIDGPKEYHDIQRQFADGTGSYDNVINNLPLFKESVKQLSARIVYTKKNKELFYIYKYIFDELGITDISFRPVMTKDEEYRLDEEEQKYVAKDICRIFDYYLEKKICGEKIKTKLFDDIVINLINREKKESFCDFGKFLSVTPEGKIYPCTHFVYNEKYYMGSIYDESINQGLLSTCIDSSIPQYSPCKKCWVLGLCGGGCKGSAAFYHNDNLFINDEFCATRKRLISHIISQITRIHIEGNLEKLKRVFQVNEPKGEITPNRWR